MRETRDPMTNKGKRSHDASLAVIANATAESFDGAGTIGNPVNRMRRGTALNLFSKDDMSHIEPALQKWVLAAKGDLNELKHRGEAAKMFIKVLHDPSMNMPALLTGQSESLSKELQDAIRRVQAYHGRRSG